MPRFLTFLLAILALFVSAVALAQTEADPTGLTPDQVLAILRSPVLLASLIPSIAYALVEALKTKWAWLSSGDPLAGWAKAGGCVLLAAGLGALAGLLGGVVPVGEAAGYAASGAIVMSLARYLSLASRSKKDGGGPGTVVPLVLLCLGLAAGSAGCMVTPAIQASGTTVSCRHDRYIRDDPKLTDAQKKERLEMGANHRKLLRVDETCPDVGR